MTLRPTTSKLEALSSVSVKPSLLFKLTSNPEFMSHVVLAACGYRVEEKELPSLAPSLQDLLKEGANMSTVEDQFKAMELLSWMVGVHLTNTNRCVCVCSHMNCLNGMVWLHVLSLVYYGVFSCWFSGVH